MASKTTLWTCFEQVPDPRGQQGKRYPLPAVLSLTAVAMLSGCRSLYAIAQFGRDHGEGLAAALGFDRGTTPCCTALHYLFKEMDVAAFESALGRWLKGRRGAGCKSVSVDGKRLRGTQGDQLPGVHLLAAYAHEAKQTLGTVAVNADTNEHKAALAWLDILDVSDTLVMGDAAFCQRDLSEKVLKKGAIISGRSRITSPGSNRRSSRRSPQPC